MILRIKVISGSEITEPNRNVGRAIMLSIGICVAVYLLVAFGVGSSLSIDEIVAARDYSLAEAAEPALGQTGFLLTVILAAVATASGVLASVFAVSRMLAMRNRPIGAACLRAGFRGKTRA